MEQNIRQLNRDYFDLKEWKYLKYKGYPLYKYPSDIINYSEIIYDKKPNLIIETGTCRGGSCVFFYDTMVNCGIKNPLVITIDIANKLPKPIDNKNILRLIGSSLDIVTIRQVKNYIKNRTVMVSLDSDHICSHVLEEMNIYNEFVSDGQYMVVEDTFLGEYGVFTDKAEERFRPDTGKTPKDAVNIFLESNTEFKIDKTRNKILSMNPNGYLLKGSLTQLEE